MYNDAAPLIRSIFLKYSIKGVAAPEKAFRITRSDCQSTVQLPFHYWHPRQQFVKFAKDCGFYEQLKPALDRLFQLCCKQMIFKCSQPIPTYPRDTDPKRPMDKLIMVRKHLSSLAPNPCVLQMRGRTDEEMEFNCQRVLERSKRAGRVPLKAYIHDELEPVFSDLIGGFSTQSINQALRLLCRVGWFHGAVAASE